MNDAERLKQKAAEAFAKGKFEKAAELYERCCVKDGKDLQARLRMGDAWAKAGRTEKALAVYQSAAEGFARQGFVPRAIAAAKLVLELDPAHEAVQRMLADLYAKKTHGPVLALEKPASRPKAKGVAPSPMDNPHAIDLPTGEEEGFEQGNFIERRPTLPEVQVEKIPILDSSGSSVDFSDQLPPELQRSFSPADSTTVNPVRSKLTAPRLPEKTTHHVTSLLEAIELAAQSMAASEMEQEEGIELSLEEIDPERQEAPFPKIPLFSDLTQDAFIQLFERCPLRRFGAGKIILRQGETGSSFFAICTGSVQVLREEGGTQRELAILGEGAFFGEVALLSGSPRTASVQSISEETQLLEISAAVLGDLARRFPQIAKALKKFCHQRLLANLMYSSPLFKMFEGAQRKAVVERFLARPAKTGERLISEGKPADGLYVVLFGAVEVRKGENVVAILKEGEVFGEISLLTKSAATADVVTIQPTALLRLPRQAFDELILTHPQILALVSQLTDDRRVQLERLSHRPQGAAELLV